MPVSATKWLQLIIWLSFGVILELAVKISGRGWLPPRDICVYLVFIIIVIFFHNKQKQKQQQTKNKQTNKTKQNKQKQTKPKKTKTNKNKQQKNQTKNIKIPYARATGTFWHQWKEKTHTLWPFALIPKS